MKYLIWSNQHGAWWGPNSLGYANDSDLAGRYSRDEAADIVERAGSYGAPEGVPNEVAVVAPEYRWDGGPPRPRASITSITCPVCLKTSHSPSDIIEGYCGNCHDWTSRTAEMPT